MVNKSSLDSSVGSVKCRSEKVVGVKKRRKCKVQG